MDVMEMWWLSLGIFTAVIVVVAVLLGLIIATARSIDQHAAAIWTVGKQIAGNTVSIWMLDQANALLRDMQDEARGIREIAGAMNQKLAALADPSRKG